MDNKGEPLIGATVQQKGSSLGTITDTEGKFSFNVEKDKGVLVVSYIGFKVQEIPFDSSTNHLKVIMQENDAVLDEVVVVGAGTQKRCQ